MELHILEHRVRVLSLARPGLWLYTHPLIKLLFLPRRSRCAPGFGGAGGGGAGVGRRGLSPGGGQRVGRLCPSGRHPAWAYPSWDAAYPAPEVPSQAPVQAQTAWGGR
jgi:hypothetical protein